MQRVGGEKSVGFGWIKCWNAGYKQAERIKDQDSRRAISYGLFTIGYLGANHSTNDGIYTLVVRKVVHLSCQGLFSGRYLVF